MAKQRDKDEQLHWRVQWDQALLNMPYNPNKRMGILLRYGAQSALAKCLGYYGNNSVYNGWYRGSKPRGERATKLLKLAGPYGSILAIIKLRDPKAKQGRHLPRWDRIYYLMYLNNDDWGPECHRGAIHLLRINSTPEIIKVKGYRYLKFT
jgi:hypothetical protein